MKHVWKRLDGYVLQSGHSLRLGHYKHSGRPALTAYSPEGEPDCNVTVNLEEPLNENEFFVKIETRKYAAELFASLLAENIAKPTGRVVEQGHVKEYAEVWRLL